MVTSEFHQRTQEAPKASLISRPRNRIEMSASLRLLGRRPQPGVRWAESLSEREMIAPKRSQTAGHPTAETEEGATSGFDWALRRRTQSNTVTDSHRAGVAKRMAPIISINSIPTITPRGAIPMSAPATMSSMRENLTASPYRSEDRVTPRPVPTSEPHVRKVRHGVLRPLPFKTAVPTRGPMYRTVSFSMPFV